jgi:hypothetical protein
MNSLNTSPSVPAFEPFVRGASLRRVSRASTIAAPAMTIAS